MRCFVVWCFSENHKKPKKGAWVRNISYFSWCIFGRLNTLTWSQHHTWCQLNLPNLNLFWICSLQQENSLVVICLAESYCKNQHLQVWTRPRTQSQELFVFSLSLLRKEMEPNFVPADTGLQEADKRLHQNLNRQFRTAWPFLFQPGPQTMARTEREAEREGEGDPSPPADALFIPQRILCYI